MDFEKITTLIIIMIIWGVSNAIRKVAAANQKKPAATDQQPGLLAILRQNLAAFQETANGEGGLGLAQYLQPPPHPPAAGPEKGPPPNRAENSRPLAPAASAGEKPAAPPAGIRATQPLPRRENPPVSGMSRRKLQDAVLWAEILAPPVALRDQ
jgi:hypothetical protein